jgi:hypothetical protein
VLSAEIQRLLMLGCILLTPLLAPWQRTQSRGHCPTCQAYLLSSSAVRTQTSARRDGQQAAAYVEDRKVYCDAALLALFEESDAEEW